jgi:hypothetical protein
MTANEPIWAVVQMEKNGTEKKTMTNREWLEKLKTSTIADIFCMEIAQDGSFCKKCPFAELCVKGENGFEVWLNKEHKGE